MHPINTLIAAILAIVLTVAIVIWLPKNCSAKEAFDDIASNDVMACPQNTKAFINSKNTIACCDAEVNGNYNCTGKTVCALSTNKQNIPLCNNYLQDIYKKESTNKCPSSMPNYFMSGSPGSKKEFCTNSALNGTLTGPSEKDAKICRFENYEFDIRNPLSCIVQKLYDSAMCPNEPCTKNAITLQTNKAVVIQLSYVDSDGIPRVCNDDTSMKNYYRDINKELDVNNINLCSISKKVYIDRSLPISKTTI